MRKSQDLEKIEIIKILAKGVFTVFRVNPPFKANASSHFPDFTYDYIYLNPADDGFELYEGVQNHIAYLTISPKLIDLIVISPINSPIDYQIVESNRKEATFDPSSKDRRSFSRTPPRCCSGKHYNNIYRQNRAINRCRNQLSLAESRLPDINSK